MSHKSIEAFCADIFGGHTEITYKLLDEYRVVPTEVNITCRDCSIKIVANSDPVFWKLLEPQDNNGTKEGLCDRCILLRLNFGVSLEDMVEEFCK